MNTRRSKSVKPKTTLEGKFAVILASLASIVVLVAILWANFFITPDSATNVQKVTTAVEIVERPKPSNTLKLSEIQPANKKKLTQKLYSAKVKPTVKRKLRLGQGNYYVQVGAFKQKKLGLLMLEKMKKHYGYARIFKQGSVRIIWVGPVITSKDAAQLKKLVQYNDNIKGFIVSKK